MTTRVFRGINYTVQTATGDNQTLQGTERDDWIEALGGNNTVSTGKGNDVILAGVNFREIDGSSPYTVLFGGDVVIYNGSSTAGNNVIDAGSGDDYVATGLGNDVVNLGSGNNIFDGGGGGNDQVFAGNGNDIIDSGNGNNIINAGGGDNRVYLTAGNSVVSAGSGNDVITTTVPGLFNGLLSYVDPFDSPPGQPYKQVINAGNGDNQIELLVFGKTSITTGSGQDFVVADSLSTLVAEFVNPALGGPVNSDSVDILTGSGNDTVITLNTKSLLKTGAGDDLIVAGAGDDTIYAGSGRDVINLRGGTFSIPSPLSNLGFGGSEVPVQGGGNDTVYLESGKDKVILGSIGFATIYGFSRNDQLDVSGLNASFTRMGGDTLVSSGSGSLGILKGYTGSVALV